MLGRSPSFPWLHAARGFQLGRGLGSWTPPRRIRLGKCCSHCSLSLLVKQVTWGLTFLWVGQGTAGRAGGFPGYRAGEGSQESQVHPRHGGTLTSCLLAGPNPAIGLGCQGRSVCGDPRGAPRSGYHRLLLRHFLLLPCFFVMVATCIALGAGRQFMAFHKSVSTPLGALTKSEQARRSFHS